MTGYENYRQVLRYLPERISSAFSKTPRGEAETINEIRLRTNRPLSVSVKGKNYYVTKSGSLTSHRSLGIDCTKADVTEAFKKVCDYSIHSFEKEIARGFITIEGGNRVGICGTAVGSSGSIDGIKYINGLNFRIASEVSGAGESICHQFFSNAPVSMLIVGEPLSGKTTLLRDICRCLGDKYRLSVIDERSEICACYCGEPQNQIGTFTDVFDGFDKRNGIETAVRVMSPQLVICDEIGGKNDCDAIIDSVNSGVKFVATVHGNNFEEVLSRPHIQKLFGYGIFEYGVLLENSSAPGVIREIKKFGR